MPRLTYQWPKEFRLSHDFVHLLMEKMPVLTDTILRGCEAICREKNEKWRARWVERFPQYPYQFNVAKSHLLAAIRASKLQ